MSRLHTIKEDIPVAMQAVTLCTGSSGGRELVINNNYKPPTPNRGEVLIQVCLAGICGTDLEMVSGYKKLPSEQILGHEFMGRIVKYGDDVPISQQLPRDTRVVAEINCVMPGSASCTAKARAQDPCRTAMGIFGRPGVFAELVTVPFVNVHRVPDGVPDEIAVFAEPMAAACQILTQVRLPRSEPVAVLGAGRLGWMVAGVLSACGCEVVVMSRGRERDARLAEAFRVVVEVVGEEMGEDRFEVVVDCTGSSSGLESAIKLVKPRGTLVLKSTTAPGGAKAVDLTPVVVKEVTVQGSRCGPFPMALRLMKKGAFDPRLLIDEVFELKDAVDAFEKATRKGTLKVLLVPSK